MHGGIFFWKAGGGGGNLTVVGNPNCTLAREQMRIIIINPPKPSG